MNDRDLDDLDKKIDIDLSIDLDTLAADITSPQWNGMLGSYNNYTYTANAAVTSKPYINSTILNNNWYSGSTISGTSFSDSKFRVTQDAEFDGDIKWKGRSLGKILETIESRLAILTPDPAKLEKYEALRKAYEHYLLMEKLIGED
jgi:hypothetical protein